MNKVQEQLIQFMTMDLVELLTTTQGVGYDQAMRAVYDSEVYAKLLDVETGLYSESPAYVFGLLQDELNFGHLVQAEI
ncbi:MAG: hypothetical protein IJ228_10805 [Succinivibrio sp.]|nr:hypothetical protein [Succinivibrio sp.]